MQAVAPCRSDKFGLVLLPNFPGHQYRYVHGRGSDAAGERIADARLVGGNPVYSGDV
jgi:hypothetical protein